MAKSYGGYAFKTGSTPSETADAGFVVLSQKVKLQAAGVSAALDQDFTLKLPPGSQLLNVVADTVTAHTSATATLAVGSSAGGTQYMAATDVKAKGRVTLSTAATIDAVQDIGSNVTVYFRLALGSVATATGLTDVTVTYIQKN